MPALMRNRLPALSGWTPARLTPAAYWKSSEWLFTDSGKTTRAVTTSDLIYDWAASIGNWDLVQATSGNRPKLNTTTFAGKPAVSTDWQTARWMTIPAALGVNTQDCSVFVVARYSTVGTAGDGQGLFNFGSAVTDLMMDMDGFPQNLRRFGPSSSFSLTTLLPYSNPLLMGCVGTPSAATGYCGNLSQSTTAFTAGTRTGGRLGARVDGFESSWDIYEFIVIQRALTAGEIRSLRSYVNDNYCPEVFTKQVQALGDSRTDGAFCTLGNTWPSLMGNTLGVNWKIWNQGQH